MAPETWGAAMLVPLSSRYSATSCHLLAVPLRHPARSHGAGAALTASILRRLPASSCRPHEMIFSPGATTSGFSLPSPVGPFEEK